MRIFSNKGSKNPKERKENIIQEIPTLISESTTKTSPRVVAGLETIFLNYSMKSESNRKHNLKKNMDYLK